MAGAERHREGSGRTTTLWEAGRLDRSQSLSAVSKSRRYEEEDVETMVRRIREKDVFCRLIDRS